MVSIPFAIPLRKKGDTISVKEGKPFVQIIPIKRENIEITSSKIDVKSLETTIEEIKNTPGYYKSLTKGQGN